MARKKITSLLGNDPVYSKQFGDNGAPADRSANSEPEHSVQPAPSTAGARDPEAPAKKSKPEGKAKPRANKMLKDVRSASEPKEAAKPKTRAVHVRAAPRQDHGPGLSALTAAGLPASDVVRLAGKRAIAKFQLQPSYSAPKQVERLSSDMSFRTMKTLDARILDKLRDQADPLRLRSDAAVIQGQLEPVFWSELTALIKELRKQYE